MRTLPPVLCALLLLALLAVSSPAVAQPGARVRISATAVEGGARVDWSAPAGQQSACIYLPPDELPVECVPGDYSSITIVPSESVTAQIAPGDTLELRSFGAGNALIQSVQAEVRWRVWLPDLAGPVEPVAASAAAAVRPLGAVQVVRTRTTLGASWRPVAGQARVCAVRVRPTPQESLEPCLEGAGGSVAFDLPRDINLQVRPGDTVELRVYDEREALLAVGQDEVASRWQMWLPRVGKGPAR